MKVSAITNNYLYNKNNTENVSQQNFTGLTKLMKKRIYTDGKKDILNIIKKRRPEQSTIVGQLPGGIFEKLLLGGLFKFSEKGAREGHCRR